MIYALRQQLQGQLQTVHSADTGNTNSNNSTQFFIYLRSELNSRWPFTELARNIKHKQ
jgi:hypothetical protein